MIFRLPFPFVRGSIAAASLFAACFGAAAGGTNDLKPNWSPGAIERLRELGIHAGITNLPSVSAPAEPERIVSKPPITADALDAKVKLGDGDKISFKIQEDKDDLKPLMVSDTGEVEIPYIGRVRAAGKTCAELSQDIKSVLEQKYYYTATVLISVDIRNKVRGRVYVSGKVKFEGPQDIPTDETYTLSKAIQRAGSFSAFADQKHVKLIRKKPGAEGGVEIDIVDVEAILKRGQREKDLPLEPDDQIFVGASTLNY